MKSSLLSAFALTFAMLGDTYLYAVLPIHAKTMFVPAIWIGFLLSINRFIRIFTNHWLVAFFHKYGFKQVTIWATIASVCSTILYGLSTTIIIWIIARLVWAFSFSALRISALSYSLESTKKGLNLGLSRGIQEIGPLFALLIGPIILIHSDPKTTFYILGIISMISIYLASHLNDISIEKYTSNNSFKIFPSSFNFLVFGTSFFIEGVLVVLISNIISVTNNSIAEIVIITSFYLAFRRLCIVILSPLSGYFSDFIGLNNIFLLSIALSILSLFIIAIGYSTVGIIGSFISNSITSALAPGNNTIDKKNRLQELATNVTWRDLGAASGALIGGFFITLQNFYHIFFIATFVLITALLFHISKFKNWKQWK